MDFPVWIGVGEVRVHPHPLFEVLAYAIGFQVYRWTRRTHGDTVTSDHRWFLITATILGALVGSKVLTWFSDPVATWEHRGDPAFLFAGKTIVGGLVGGWLAVEATKRRLGITRATGDVYAVALAVGIAIGRIGCFLTGLPDQTHGDATTLPWAVDYGDGIARHPTQLYEILALATLAATLLWLRSRPHREGDLFRLFMAGYCAWRLLVGFIQPGVPILGLTAIQWTCLLVLVYYADQLPRFLRKPEVTPTA